MPFTFCVSAMKSASYTGVFVVWAILIVSCARSRVAMTVSSLCIFKRYSIADLVSSGLRSESKVVCFHMTFKHSISAMSAV